MRRKTGKIGSDRITTPFTAESTAAQVLDGVGLTGRRAVVTGGASGIGVETVRALAAAGAEVTLAVRDRQAGERVADEEIQRLRAATGGGGSWKTLEQGAATSVLLAASPLLDGVGGRYFEDCQEAAPHRPGTRTGVAAYALDPEAATLLWQVTLDTLAA